jgi:hypothetical protein
VLFAFSSHSPATVLWSLRAWHAEVSVPLQLPYKQLHTQLAYIMVGSWRQGVSFGGGWFLLSCLEECVFLQVQRMGGVLGTPNAVRAAREAYSVPPVLMQNGLIHVRMPVGCRSLVPTLLAVIAAIGQDSCKLLVS